MPIVKEDLEAQWTALSAEDERLKNRGNYVSLMTIDSTTHGRQLFIKNCEEVVYFEGNREIWNTKSCSGVMTVPAGISVKIYKGTYSI